MKILNQRVVGFFIENKLKDSFINFFNNSRYLKESEYSELEVDDHFSEH